MTLKTFAPKGDATVPLTATVVTASATIDKFSNACRVYNAGPSMAFIRFSTGAASALTTDMPLPAGSVETFTKGSADTVAAICAAGTASLYFTNGEGL